jgi:hypothetical protein
MQKRVNEGLAGGADVLVATPGLLQKYMDQGIVEKGDGAIFLAWKVGLPGDFG